MEVVVGKRVTNINDPHLRLEAYLDLVELVSGAYGDKANPSASYLTITAEKEGMTEKEYLGGRPVGEIREYLKQARIIEIEYSIPSSFVIGGRVWHTRGEGVVIYGEEVNLSCSNLDAEEVRNVQELVRKSSNDFAIEFLDKRIRGEG